MSNPGFSRKLRYGVEAAAWRAFMGFFRLLGVDAASAVGGFIGRHVLAHLGWAKKARQNLAVAFPEKSETEREALVVQVCDNVGDHLIGNVYARYEWETEAQAAVDNLNERWYAGKYLNLVPLDIGETYRKFQIIE